MIPMHLKKASAHGRQLQSAMIESRLHNRQLKYFLFVRKDFLLTPLELYQRQYLEYTVTCTDNARHLTGNFLNTRIQNWCERFEIIW